MQLAGDQEVQISCSGCSVTLSIAGYRGSLCSFFSDCLLQGFISCFSLKYIGPITQLNRKIACVASRNRIMVLVPAATLLLSSAMVVELQGKTNRRQGRWMPKDKSIPVAPLYLPGPWIVSCFLSFRSRTPALRLCQPRTKTLSPCDKDQLERQPAQSLAGNLHEVVTR